MIMPFLNYFKNLLKPLAKIAIVIGVLIFVINLFFILSEKSNRDPSAQSIDLLDVRRVQLYEKFARDEKTDQGKIMTQLTKHVMCSSIGEACGDTPEEAKKNQNNGFIGSVAALAVAPISYPPASGINETNTALVNAGFIPKSYAAEGLGFASIKPYKKIWLKVRDLSFMLVVLTIIIMGFLIMFRKKINPQLAVSIENSLPRIVMVLILIPLSFAISGFLIDLMYVVIALAINMFAQLEIGRYLQPGNTASLINDYMHAPFRLIWPLQLAGPSVGLLDFIQVGHAFANIFPTVITRTLRLLMTGYIAKLIISDTNKGHIMSLVTGAIEAIPGVGQGVAKVVSALIIILVTAVISPYVPGIIIGLIIFLSILVFMFKIFFLLIKTYIKILLLILLSPVIILLDIFPGQGNFGNWMKELCVELLTYPAVIVLTLMGYAIIQLHSELFSLPSPVDAYLFKNEGFKPPFLHGITGNDFGVLIGLAIILLIPELVPKFKEKLGVKSEGLNWGGAFFGGLGLAGKGLLSLYMMGQLPQRIFDRLPTSVQTPPALNTGKQARAQALGGLIGRLTGGGGP